MTRAYTLHWSPMERFWMKVEPEPNSGCWLWVGHRDNGYGQFSIRGRLILAHRFIYQEERGAIAPGLQVDHLCKNPSCVNPAHLEAVTPLDNVRRSSAAAMRSERTACPQGHEYDGFQHKSDGSAQRICSVCRRRDSREWARRNQWARRHA